MSYSSMMFDDFPLKTTLYIAWWHRIRRSSLCFPPCFCLRSSIKCMITHVYLCICCICIHIDVSKYSTYLYITSVRICWILWILCDMLYTLLLCYCICMYILYCIKKWLLVVLESYRRLVALRYSAASEDLEWHAQQLRMLRRADAINTFGSPLRRGFELHIIYGISRLI